LNHIAKKAPYHALHSGTAHWIFKAHLTLGMTIFLVFPFTRLVHVWSAPVWYLGRRGYQVVRSTRASGAHSRRPETGVMTSARRQDEQRSGTGTATTQPAE
jgi:nitrate reductase gamma subunit